MVAGPIVGFNADRNIWPNTSTSLATPVVAALASMPLLTERLAVTDDARATGKETLLPPRHPG
jgi:hypothetical protein